MRIAYFINQYPKVSHSFIRREILALERQGFEVQRVALRGWDAELVDAEDVSERDKTRYVLQDGVKGLLAPALQVLRAQPRRFFSALGLALRMGRRADRSWPYIWSTCLRRAACSAGCRRLAPGMCTRISAPTPPRW